MKNIFFIWDNLIHFDLFTVRYTQFPTDKLIVKVFFFFSLNLLVYMETLQYCMYNNN